MDQELRTRWLEALRSGKYTQGKERLKTRNDDGSASHCCLGVLAEVMGVPSALPNSLAVRSYRFDFGNGVTDTAYLPGDLVPGLNQQNQSLLADMNDEGKSFDEIADYIEEHL